MGYKYTKGRTKELKERNGLCFPFSYTSIMITELLKMWCGLQKYQGYRKLAGLFQFQPSPPLTLCYMRGMELRDQPGQ